MERNEKKRQCREEDVNKGKKISKESGEGRKNDKVCGTSKGGQKRNMEGM